MMTKLQNCQPIHNKNTWFCKKQNKTKTKNAKVEAGCSAQNRATWKFTNTSYGEPKYNFQQNTALKHLFSQNYAYLHLDRDLKRRCRFSTLMFHLHRTCISSGMELTEVGYSVCYMQ